MNNLKKKWNDFWVSWKTKRDLKKQTKKQQEDTTKIKTVDSSDSKKRKFKMPTVFTLLLIVIAFMVFLTWVIPAGAYTAGYDSNDFQENIHFYSWGSTRPMGIIDIFWAIGAGFLDAAELIFFLFMIGGFIHIVVQSKAIEAAVGSILKKYDKKMIWVIPPLMLLFGAFGTSYGMCEETLVLYPILVPIFILAGFDALTGVMIILLGAGVGVLNSTVNPFAIGAAVDSVGDNVIVGVGDGMGYRFLMWVVMEFMVIFFVMWYAWKVKKDPNKSSLDKTVREKHLEEAKASFNIEDIPKFDQRRKFMLFFFLFALFFMIFSIMPWSEWGVTVFIEFRDAIAQNFPYWSRMLAPIGEFYFLELGIIFLLFSFIIAFASGLGEKKFMAVFVEGMQGMLTLALILGMARGVKMILLGEQLPLIFMVDSIPNGVWDQSLSFHQDVNSDISKIFIDFLNDINNDIANGGASNELEEWLKSLEWVAFENGINNVDYMVAIPLEVGINSTILNSMSNSLSGVSDAGFFVLIYIMYLPLSVFIPSTSGLAGATMPIFGPLADMQGGTGDPSYVAGAITAYSTSIGVVNLVSPTQGVVMGGLAVAGVSYEKYLKTVWKFILAIVIVSMCFLALGAIKLSNGSLLIGI